MLTRWLVPGLLGDPDRDNCMLLDAVLAPALPPNVVASRLLENTLYTRFVGIGIAREVAESMSRFILLEIEPDEALQVRWMLHEGVSPSKVSSS
jgi:hypothetical protein